MKFRFLVNLYTIGYFPLLVHCYVGTIPSGLQLHPDGAHLIYPVGCTVVIEKVANKQQEFLAGHTSTVSCLTLSRSGNFIASGQCTHMGFKVTTGWPQKSQPLSISIMISY